MHPSNSSMDICDLLDILATLHCQPSGSFIHPYWQFLTPLAILWPYCPFHDPIGYFVTHAHDMTLLAILWLRPMKLPYCPFMNIMPILWLLAISWPCCPFHDPTGPNNCPGHFVPPEGHEGHLQTVLSQVQPSLSPWQHKQLQDLRQSAQEPEWSGSPSTSARKIAQARKQCL